MKVIVEDHPEEPGRVSIRAFEDGGRMVLDAELDEELFHQLGENLLGGVTP
jgi:hypothetical protein